MADAEKLLSVTERCRYARLRSAEARRDFLAVRVFARHVLADVTGVAVEDVALAQTCPGCGAEGHGPPRLVGGGAEISWAHSGGELAVAVSSRYRVGVDVERTDRLALTPALLAAALPKTEIALVTAARDTRRAFLELWTVKEALAKLGSDVLTAARRTTGELSESVGAVDHWTEDRGNVVLGVAVATSDGESGAARPPGRRRR